ncbi:MAG: Gfo/Idh/MocA family oxidoreductase [Eubacteriales bacterium]
MSEKLRIGVFGGYRGSSMIQVLLHHPDAELVAVCDKYQPLLDKAKAEAEAAGLNIRVFNNFDDFLAYDMDAVVLANYATEHATFAIRASAPKARHERGAPERDYGASRRTDRNGRGDRARLYLRGKLLLYGPDLRDVEKIPRGRNRRRHLRGVRVCA